MRLSALGDVCHALPVVRTLQARYPMAKITWVIGKLEHQLIGDIPEIDFVIFDKSQGLGAYKKLRGDMRGKYFDLLLHTQTSARSNFAAWLIPAKVKLGYDKARSREGHQLIINQSVAAGTSQHQIDDMFDFTQALGIKEKILEWNIPIPQAAKEFAAQKLNTSKPILAINACSSPSKRVHRNWQPEGYANVASYAEKELGMQVVLVGGPTELEQQAANTILNSTLATPINLVGKTNLKQLCAVLEKADILLTSDSGPAHIATAVGSRVLCLHAATNPYQTGPYLDMDRAVNQYPAAIQAEYDKPADEVSWGTRAHGEDVMQLITTDMVKDALAKATKSN
jgi:heptosyltransferase I